VAGQFSRREGIDLISHFHQASPLSGERGFCIGKTFVLQRRKKMGFENMYEAGEEIGKQLQKLPLRMRIAAVLAYIVLTVMFVMAIGAAIQYFQPKKPGQIENLHK
jgi:hypothetical protein